MTAVPAAPEPKKLQITVDGEQLHIITKVKTFDGDVKAFKSRIKTLKEQILEELEGTDEYNEVLKLESQLKIAKEKLKRKLQSNSTYNDLMSELADEKLALSDAESNLSDFLLAYFADTRERQIDLGIDNAREVILKGKLGKATDFQTNLFSANTAKE